MWGGCGEGSCLRGWRVQWQLKGEEWEAVAGNNANLLINLASHSQPERSLRNHSLHKYSWSLLSQSL